MSTIVYVLLALLMLSIMVTVHEAGHFFAARACGIPVRSFGIGFGPKLISWTSKKTGIEFGIRLIPAGGYCGFYGDELEIETGKGEKKQSLVSEADVFDIDDTVPEAVVVGNEVISDWRCLRAQAPWKRLITLFAGPFMNFVLAFVVAFFFYLGYGLPYAGDTVSTQIVSVAPDSPADVAGLQAGDVILRANGVEITDNLTPIISNWDGGEPLHFTVKRGDEEIGMSLTPDYIATENRYMIGVTLTVGTETVWRHDGLGTTLGHTWDVCLDAGGSILSALKGLVTRGEGLNEMSGPVGVINLIAQQTQAYKLMGYLNLLIIISINLGLVNLLPIPGLDGGHILFVLFEIIFRRPVNRRVEAYIHLAGYAFLMCVMLYFTFHDVLNIFG